jgi:hypothetical protein
MKELKGRLIHVQPNGIGIVKLDDYEKDGYFDIYQARYAGVVIKLGNRLTGKARWTLFSTIKLHDIHPLVEMEQNSIKTVIS